MHAVPAATDLQVLETVETTVTLGETPWRRHMYLDGQKSTITFIVTG